jgi:hypothetical protein
LVAIAAACLHNENRPLAGEVPLHTELSKPDKTASSFRLLRTYRAAVTAVITQAKKSRRLASASGMCLLYFVLAAHTSGPARLVYILIGIAHLRE